MSLYNDKKRVEILKELNSLKKKDFSFSSGHILGSMCTQPHPIAKEAYQKFLETNLGDPELFPGTKEIESKFITFISDLLHAPKYSAGQIVSGGTEGNITAMWIAKQLTGKKEIILADSAHFSFKKIESIMDMKLIKVPLTIDYNMDVLKIKDNIKDNTAAILGIAGSTELGTIDPIPELSDICLDENLFLHVDAAFGGYVIPFLKELNYQVPDFDFKLKGVSTISTDAHKMGYSVIPLGTLIIRDYKWLDEISVESLCTGSKKQSGIFGTRSGGPVAAAYAVTRYLGVGGYKKLVENCMTITKYTEEKITDMGLHLITKPTMNVLGIKLKKLPEVINKLSKYGWKVNKIDHLSCIRIVIMPQITKKIIDKFIPILRKTCEEVGEL
ncbi:MAG: tyrosine decarboxylase MfnA [Thermoplasmatales archaeon]|nr:MAG: tyrosine decarboxylase MfnA [Thermoplasmatales archaeon]